MGLHIYPSTLDLCQPLKVGIEGVLSTIPADTICGIVVCGTSDKVEYHTLLDELKSAFSDILCRRVPITLVPQTLLPENGLAVEIYSLDGGAAISIKEHDDICYGLIESDNESLLFVEGVAASDFSASVAEQSHEVFAKLESILSHTGFAVDDIVRQWNYIGGIVSYRGNKQNYQEFNDARTAYYSKGEWSNGYPAATGIGTVGEGIVVSAIAFKHLGNSAIHPIDNPLQVAAHIYSKSVLIDDNAGAIKSTPKFERAKVIETERGACCFVSGTAAIRGEESVDANSAELQTVRTIENIEYLVSKENLVRFGCKPYDLKYAKLHIFIKREEDYDAVRQVVEKAYPQVAAVYTIADVCRQELLVEIEGILIS